MYRCPRCNVEIAPNALYCPRCGFNQTNARMQKVAPPSATQSTTPITPDPSINPDVSTELPPAPSTPQPSSPRSLQPEVKHVIPPRPSLNKQVPPPIKQASPSSLSIRQQMSPTQMENPQRQEVKDVTPPVPVRPVRTNTPPRPGKIVPERAYKSRPYTDTERPHNDPERAYKSHPYTDTERPHSDPSHPHIEERPDVAKLEAGQGQADETNAQGLTLTKRYMSEQETRHQPASPNAASTLVEIPPTRTTPPPVVPPTRAMFSTNRDGGASETVPHPELAQGIGTTSTMVHPSKAPMDADTFTGEGAESLIATSKAAEHWRQSWRDRQHAEAGPAVGITRGQADVPEPLMAMQNSIARMRAIIVPKNATTSPGKNVGFWITLILMLCIIGGMGAYVISTYAPSTQLAAQISGAGNVSPALTMQGDQKNTITAGQTLHVHGTYFGANHAITFILDTTPLAAAPVQSNNNGSFDASLAIPTTWLAGSYALQAQDKQAHAFLDLQILPGTLTMSNNTSLVLSMNGLPLPTSGLTFTTVMDKNTTASQQITLINSGGTPVQWSAAAIADNNLSWLVINDGKTGGTLNISGTDRIGLSVSTNGLPSSTKPYRGSFILTVNRTQAIIPVSLTVQDTSLEVVVNPNPVIAYLQGGGTCQPATLTLINLSSQIVTWNANPYDMDKPHIHLDGLTTDQGTLDPEGQATDTKVIQITCIGAQAGEKLYHINVYYNGVAVNVPVSIRYAKI